VRAGHLSSRGLDRLFRVLRDVHEIHVDNVHVLKEAHYDGIEEIDREHADEMEGLRSRGNREQDHLEVSIVSYAC
jgi:hypothetical protein